MDIIIIFIILHLIFNRSKSKPKVEMNVNSSLKPAPTLQPQKIEVESSVNITSEPRSVRVFDVDIIVGKVTGRLVLHQSSVTGEISRLLMLEARHGRSKTIRLEARTGNLDEIIKSSVSEAKSLGIEIFGKKKGKPSTTATTAKVATVLQENKPQRQAPTPPVEMPVAIAATPPSKEDTNLIIKGFLSSYEGTFISGEVEQHLKVVNGAKERYSSFTATVDTPVGPKTVQGNDLDRALREAEVKPGNRVRILHVGNTPYGNGRSKKLFSVINLDRSVTSSLVH